MKSPACLLALTTIALLFLPFAAPAQTGAVTKADEYLTIVSTFGEKLEAKILDASDTAVQVKTKAGREVSIPMERISEASKTDVAAWKKEDAKSRIPWLELKVTNLRRDGKDGSDYDNRSQRVLLELELENRERDFDVEGATMTIVALAKSVRDKRLGCCLKETAEIDLPANRTAELMTKKGTVRYDNNGSANFGFKYYGYAIFVTNAAGKVIYRQYHPESLEDSGDLLLQAKAGYYIDKEFKPTKERSSYLGSR